MFFDIFGRGGDLYTPDALLYRLGDDLNALVLCYAGICGVRSWRRARAVSGDALYWLLAGLGMWYLALDELLSLHELAGEVLWEHGWSAPDPPFSRNDDAILFAVALCGLGLTAIFFRALLERPRAAWWLLAGLALTATAILADWFALATVVEEAFELVAAAMLAVAFVTRLRATASADGTPAGGPRPAGMDVPTLPSAPT